MILHCCRKQLFKWEFSHRQRPAAKLYFIDIIYSSSTSFDLSMCKTNTQDWVTSYKAMLLSFFRALFCKIALHNEKYHIPSEAPLIWLQFRCIITVSTPFWSLLFIFPVSIDQFSLSSDSSLSDGLWTPGHYLKTLLLGGFHNENEAHRGEI